MFVSPHVSGKELADLCHRLAISAESGVDIRRTWEREADAARGRVASQYATVRDGVKRGDGLSVSLARTGKLFPRLFLEMVHVGEQTGCLSEVLHRLSDHYQRRHEMTRQFRRRLIWPMLELSAALVIVGVLLWLIAVLGAETLSGEPMDVLGLGVTGMDAVTLYVEIVIAAGLTLYVLIAAARRGRLSTRWLQHAVMRVPKLGAAVEMVCLARLAWVLHLTLNVEMDLRRLVPLALRATGSDYYASHAKAMSADVASGSTLYEAFSAAGIFPHHFLDALQVAEESGQLVESMGRLSDQYEREAEDAVGTISVLLSFVIWGLVMLIITVMIIRFFKLVYLDPINDALEMTR